MLRQALKSINALRRLARKLSLSVVLASRTSVGNLDGSAKPVGMHVAIYASDVALIEAKTISINIVYAEGALQTGSARRVSYCHQKNTRQPRAMRVTS